MFAKLCSLCVTSRSALLAEHAIAWDRRAKRICLVGVCFQCLMLIFYLGLTAGKPSAPVRSPPRPIARASALASAPLPDVSVARATVQAAAPLRKTPRALASEATLRGAPCRHFASLHAARCALPSAPPLRPTLPPPRAPPPQERYQTICSEKVSEHSFHFAEGFIAILAVLSVFGMIFYLQMSAYAAVKRGLKEVRAPHITDPCGLPSSLA
jgi:hypothetical protein